MTMRVAVLSGGVGGAKLLEGLHGLADRPNLTAILNTGDDFTHLGLRISPDIDTALYSLGGLSDRERGWGRRDESWRFMEAIEQLGGPTWFQLGDQDLALHAVRTGALAEGQTLAQITERLAARLGIHATLIPMSNDPVATIVDTDEGTLPFQDYFVARQCAPRLRSIRFEGAGDAAPAPGVIEAIEHADAVFIAPSNPFLSIAPILAVPGIRESLQRTTAPVIAVSPLIGGQSIKGPTSKIMTELGLTLCDRSIADHYASLLDGIVTDPAEAPLTGIACAQTATLMRTAQDKQRVAQCALDLARSLAG